MLATTWASTPRTWIPTPRTWIPTPRTWIPRPNNWVTRPRPRTNITQSDQPINEQTKQQSHKVKQQCTTLPWITEHKLNNTAVPAPIFLNTSGHQESHQFLYYVSLSSHTVELIISPISCILTNKHTSDLIFLTLVYCHILYITLHITDLNVNREPSSSIESTSSFVDGKSNL